MRRFACVLLMLLHAALSEAGTLRARFLEPGAGPLLGVEVVLRRASDSTVVAHRVSGEQGAVVFDSLALDRYLLRASLIGHAAHQAAVELTTAAPDLDLGSIPLKVTAIGMPGVETRTERGSAIVAADRTLYLAKDLPVAGGGRATDLLRAVPEIDLDVDDRVSLRGSNSVSLQINGRVSPLKGDALTAFLRQFPAARIERIEVVNNPSAKYDPEGSGGIVNIVTKEPLDLGLSGTYSLTLGDRGSGPNARLAWQQGKLTLAGGLSGYWNNNDYRYEEQRRNLLASPTSTYRATSDNTYRSSWGNFDGSLDYAFDKRLTGYATLTGWLSDSRNTGTTRTTLADDVNGTGTLYDRGFDGDYDNQTESATVGLRRVKEVSRDEWTLEARVSRNWNGTGTSSAQTLFLPSPGAGQTAVQDGESELRDASLQWDRVQPLGKKGKLESGYRLLGRTNENDALLVVTNGPAGGGRSLYRHVETFHSAYLIAGSTVGRFSAQLGARGELANTAFEARLHDARYDQDYRSLYPSASAVWDFGGGRTARLSYSKRIERPWANMLDPDPPALDTLNRFVGNPQLAPKYTHLYGLDLTWMGSRGMLRLSPFLRDTYRNWDTYRTVDANGVALTTYRNAASVRATGVTLMGSLRQIKRLGGTLSLSVYRETHDASNLAGSARQATTAFSVNGNVSYKATPKLSCSVWASGSPAQTLAQGRRDATVFSNLGARYEWNRQFSVSASVNDPFKLWHFASRTADATHVQSSENRGSIRRFSLTFLYAFGKPPELKQRKQTDEAPPADAGGTPR